MGNGNSNLTPNSPFCKTDVSSSHIDIIKLADKIINGDKNTYGMIDCLEHYYNGAFNDDLQKLGELKSKVGL